MLLTAARMLKENEKELKGTVKFMFQPAEEIFEGSKDMVENGLLKNPKPDVALATHVVVGRIPIGTYMYNSKDTMMYSVDGFKITAASDSCPCAAYENAGKKIYAVQFHPEASGGPVDTEFLFDDFIQNIEKCRK